MKTYDGSKNFLYVRSDDDRSPIRKKPDVHYQVHRRNNQIKLGPINKFTQFFKYTFLIL